MPVCVALPERHPARPSPRPAGAAPAGAHLHLQRADGGHPALRARPERQPRGAKVHRVRAALGARPPDDRGGLSCAGLGVWRVARGQVARGLPLLHSRSRRSSRSSTWNWNWSWRFTVPDSLRQPYSLPARRPSWPSASRCPPTPLAAAWSRWVGCTPACLLACLHGLCAVQLACHSGG